jgi:hypothetical protein
MPSQISLSRDNTFGDKGATLTIEGKNILNYCSGN